MAIDSEPRASPQFLSFVTAEEEARLFARATRAAFEPDAVILEEGDVKHAIFLIREGVVRVELDHPEFNIEVARLKRGELFGEMSFLEGMTVSANVIADDHVEVDIVDADVIAELTAKDHGFCGRVYQSLAQILARRLRETTLRGFG